VNEVKTITHTVECGKDQYWEIEYEYRNNRLMSIAINFHQDGNITYNESFVLSSWRVEGDLGLPLAKLAYYLKTDEYESMFPHLIFKNPIKEVANNEL